MYVITFDLVTSETARSHPKGVSQAYTDIGKTLARFDFHGIQGSVYLTNNDELSNMYRAVEALKGLPWIADSLRELRVLRADEGSDFTDILRGTAAALASTKDD